MAVDQHHRNKHHPSSVGFHSFSSLSLFYVVYIPIKHPHILQPLNSVTTNESESTSRLPADATDPNILVGGMVSFSPLSASDGRLWANNVSWCLPFKMGR